MVVFCTYLAKELECYELLMPLYFPPSGKSTDDVINEYKKQRDEVKVDTKKILEEVEKEEKEEAEKKEAWKKSN